MAQEAFTVANPVDGRLGLGDVDRNTLRSSQGVAYKDFRRGLTPSFVRVWVDILAGHAALALSVLGLVYVERWEFWRWPGALLGALLIGYTLAYTQLFFHEAAHYNIAPTRTANDLLYRPAYLTWDRPGSSSRCRTTRTQSPAPRPWDVKSVMRA